MMDPIAAAAHAIALSLEHEPFYQAISVDCSERRESVLTHYMEYSLREAQRIGRCVLADDPACGGAAWTLPQPPEKQAAESAAKHAFLQQLLGHRGFDNYRHIVSFMAVQLPASLPADAWYLSILGVHPSAQGRGIGARLLQPTLEEASAAGACSYVETFEPRNNNFYRRAGFDWLASIQEPVTQAEYRIFRRDA
jgi:GNAT superfamily N-acetyltransferase